MFEKRWIKKPEFTFSFWRQKTMSRLGVGDHKQKLPWCLIAFFALCDHKTIDFYAHGFWKWPQTSVLIPSTDYSPNQTHSDPFQINFLFIVWQRFCELSPDLGFPSVCVCCLSAVYLVRNRIPINPLIFYTVWPKWYLLCQTLPAASLFI